MDVRIHNEAYTRVHLGFMGVNLDFFSCRICYKGGAHYAFNIMQVIHPSPLSTKYRLSMSVFGFWKRQINVYRQSYEQRSPQKTT